MLGLPHQTVEEVLGSIRFAAELGAVHLSAYMLQLEEGTPYAARYTESDIDEETQRQIYLAAIAELERLGFHQYEISNFARPGFESRHNLKYWRCEEYLGVGPAAASCLGGRRFVFPRDIDAFLRAENPWSLCEDEGEAGSPEEPGRPWRCGSGRGWTAPPWKRPVRGMTPERCSSGQPSGDERALHRHRTHHHPHPRGLFGGGVAHSLPALGIIFICCLAVPTDS